MNLFRPYIKQVLFHWPLLLLLVIFQLFLGRISSVALGERTPEIVVAVCQQSPGEYADRYMEALCQIHEIELVKVAYPVNMETVFNDHSLQGLLLIPDYFDEYLLAGKSYSAIFYAAPGIADSALIEEYLTVEIALIRADIILQQQLELHDPGGVSAAPYMAGLDDILTIEYEGPPLQGMQPFAFPPAYGVPALFLFLAFLHACQIAPGRDTRRIMLRGSQMLAKCALACTLVLWAVWATLVILYAIGLFLFFHILIDAGTLCALICLSSYAVFAGTILSATGKRAWANPIFLAWLLANMTFGGGLYGLLVNIHPALYPVLPVSAVLSASGNFTSIFVLAAACVLCLFLCFAIYQGKGALARKSHCVV